MFFRVFYRGGEFGDVLCGGAHPEGIGEELYFEGYVRASETQGVGCGGSLLVLIPVALPRYNSCLF